MSTAGRIAESTAERFPLRLLQDWLAVKRDEPAKQKGLIILPENRSQTEEAILGTVLGVGPGRTYDSGVHLLMGVAVGARVLISKYAGQELRLRGGNQSHPQLGKEGEVMIIPEVDVYAEILADGATLRPLYDRVVIKRGAEEKVSRGGIIIPDMAKEKALEGEVLAVGSGKVLPNGRMRALVLRSGDRVLFGKYGGTEVEVGGDKLMILREDDVLGTLEAEPAAA